MVALNLSRTTTKCLNLPRHIVLAGAQLAVRINLIIIKLFDKHRHVCTHVLPAVDCD